MVGGDDNGGAESIVDLRKIRRERFCQAYVKHGNATQAYLDAGYDVTRESAASQGSALFGNLEIQARIRGIIAENAEAEKATKEYLASRFMQIAERCMQAEPVMDAEGNKTGEFTFQAPAAVRALGELGRLKGLYVEKHEHSGPGGGPIDIATMTPEQRAARLDELLRKRNEEAGGVDPSEPEGEAAE